MDHKDELKRMEIEAQRKTRVIEVGWFGDNGDKARLLVDKALNSLMAELCADPDVQDPHIFAYGGGTAEEFMADEVRRMQFDIANSIREKSNDQD